MRVRPGRIAVGLLPYALAATAVVVASAIAIGGTIRARPVPDADAGAVAPLPTPATRQLGLSDARMAYWRQNAAGSFELWVGDLDGGRRWPVATASGDADLGLTRWSPEGSAVAYRTGNATIGVLRLDGAPATLAMPLELRRAAWKVVSFEWSPDAKRIAATFRAGNGLSNESDVYVAEARANAAWERVTTLGDAYAGTWLDGDRLFVETASGLVGVLDLGTKELRPVTGLPATSPLLVSDGRVYFTGGLSVNADVLTQPVGAGWVWSATVDGNDLRKETAVEHGQARLFGMLADGRAVIGVPGGVYLASDTLVPLVFVGAGTVRRVIVPDDGKRLIGITESRILQIDAAKVPRDLPLGSLPPPAAAATILSGIREPDVWTVRRPVAAVRGAVEVTSAPKARLAFVLGHALWELQPDGSARALATERGALLGRPAWSPAGDRVAVLFNEIGARDPLALIVGRAGTQRIRLPNAAQALTWSPDGAALTVWAPTGARLDQWTTRSIDPASGRSGEMIEGRAVWGGGGRVVLSDGELEVTTGTAAASAPRVGQRIDLVSGSTRRTITDARRLASAALLKNVPDASRTPLITQILPSADPEYVAVTLSRLGQQAGTTRSPTTVVLRISDGEPVNAFSLAVENGPFDMAWSPVGHLLGWTANEGPVGATAPMAIVMDPVTGSIVLRAGGRFAGWTADDQWAYVARDQGLFAHRIDRADDPVRVSPFGVLVTAAKP